MFRHIKFLSGLLVLLISSICAGAPTDQIHQNKMAPPPLAPLFEGSGSEVLERMARFLDDYQSNFRNHSGCPSGRSSLTYGYSKCEEDVFNGIYTTTKLLTEDVVHLQKYAAVFYQYSGDDAAAEKDRLVAIVEQRLPIGKSDGSWDLKFRDDESFHGYHYHWAGSEVFKLWVRWVDGELRVSATAYLSKSVR